MNHELSILIEDYKRRLKTLYHEIEEIQDNLESDYNSSSYEKKINRLRVKLNSQSCYYTFLFELMRVYKSESNSKKELFMVWGSRGILETYQTWPIAIFDSIDKAEKFKKEEDEKCARIKKKCPCQNPESEEFAEYQSIHGHYLDNFQTDIQMCILNGLI